VFVLFNFLRCHEDLRSDMTLLAAALRHGLLELASKDAPRKEGCRDMM
jgi:hypothetical protein